MTQASPSSQGTCDAAYQGLRDLFEKNLVSGAEVGASIAVNVDGRDVVNLWGGHADAKCTRPWQETTIVNMFSTTKIVSAIAVLKLVDEGLLSVTDKVAKHWPEFAANGKEDVEIRHLLSHSSGLAGWATPMTWEDVFDLEKSTAKLAEQAPLWPPGTASGYHAWTYGHLLGEVVRRVSGLSLTEFVATKLAQPTEADVQIGCKEEDWPRIAELLPPSELGLPPIPPDSITAKAFMNPPPVANLAETAAWRKAEVGAANGHGNAHGLVRLLSAVTLAGSDTRVLSTKATAELIFEEQVRGPDVASGLNLRFGNGMALAGNGDTALDGWLPRGRICCWGGWGGSMGIIDIDRKMTISYVMNKMRHELPVAPIVKAYFKEIYKGVGVEVEAS